MNEEKFNLYRVAVFSFLIIWIYIVTPREVSKILIPAVMFFISLRWIISAFKDTKGAYKEIENNTREFFSPKKNREFIDKFLGVCSEHKYKTDEEILKEVVFGENKKTNNNKHWLTRQRYLNIAEGENIAYLLILAALLIIAFI